MKKRPILTARGDLIYGDPPSVIVARVYDDPELAAIFAAAPEMLTHSKEVLAWVDPLEGYDNPAITRLRADVAKAETTT